MDNKQKFTNYYVKNTFGDKQSRSGEGSNMEGTEVIRKELPLIIEEYSIKNILDAPCGDWFWMKTLNLSGLEYTGIDIVDEIIKINKAEYSKPNIQFMIGDVVMDDLPKVDLVLCRDCLVHLNYKDALNTIDNFKNSGSRYLLTTTFPNYKKGNIDLADSCVWRPLNLESPPFNLKNIIRTYFETTTNSIYGGKALILLDLKEI